MTGPQPTLIILGASARAAAQSATRAGYQPYSIDLFADADLRELGPTQRIERYPSEFLTTLAVAPDAPWIYTGGLENYPRLVSRLSQLRPLLGNGPEVLSKVRDPRWLAQVLAGTELRYPETRLPGEPWPTEGAWILKPRRTGGGMGIRDWSANAGLSSSLNRGQVLQRRVPGESLSAAFVCFPGRVELLGVAEQWIGRDYLAPQEFQYAGSLAPAVITPTEQQALLRAAERLSSVAGMRGVVGFDLLRNAAGLWLIEVNPRYTASLELYEALTGRALIREHCRACGAVENRLSFATEMQRQGPYDAKLIVYASATGIAGKSLQETLHCWGEKSVRAADIPCLGSRIEQSSPICTLLTSGESPPDIRNQLFTAARQIQDSLESLSTQH